MAARIIEKEMVVISGITFVKRSDMPMPVVPELDPVLDHMIKNETGEFPEVREIVQGAQAVAVAY